MFVFSNLFKVMEIYEIYTKKESFFVLLSFLTGTILKFT